MHIVYVYGRCWPLVGVDVLNKDWRRAACLDLEPNQGRTDGEVLSTGFERPEEDGVLTP